MQLKVYRLLTFIIPTTMRTNGSQNIALKRNSHKRKEIIWPKLKNLSTSTVQRRQFKRELCGCATTTTLKISLKVAEKHS